MCSGMPVACVAELSGAGMSTRAVAGVVGVSHMTAQRDASSGVTPVTPAPTTGRDGKTYPAKAKPVEPVEDGVEAEEPKPAPKPKRRPVGSLVADAHDALRPGGDNCEEPRTCPPRLHHRTRCGADVN